MFNRAFLVGQTSLLLLGKKLPRNSRHFFRLRDLDQTEDNTTFFYFSPKTKNPLQMLTSYSHFKALNISELGTRMQTLGSASCSQWHELRTPSLRQTHYSSFTLVERRADLAPQEPNVQRKSTAAGLFSLVNSQQPTACPVLCSIPCALACQLQSPVIFIAKQSTEACRANFLPISSSLYSRGEDQRWSLGMDGARRGQLPMSPRSIFLHGSIPL